MSDSWNLKLTLVGTNHRYTSIDLRERLWCQQESLPHRLRSLVRSDEAIKETVVLSTCNRTEIYAITARNSNITERLIEMMGQWSGIQPTNLKPHTYSLIDEAAVSHLFAVASGLDSLVIGEQQIQDQVRDAAKIAGQAGTTGRFLSELFHHGHKFASKVRSQSGFGVERASVSSAAISLLKHASGNRPMRSILLIGAGKMIKLAADDLAGLGETEVLVANRTVQRAEELVKRLGGKGLPFNEIPAALRKVDAVLSCVSSAEYIIKAEDLRTAMAVRSDKSLVLIDAAVPRNIDPATAKIDGVQLYNIDDLGPYLNGGQESQEPRLTVARNLIRLETEEFYRRMRSYNTVDTLKNLRQIAEEIRERELSRALRRLGDMSEHDREIVDLLTRRIVNKLLHEPTVRLKEHASDGDGEVYEAAVRELFATSQETKQ